MVFTGSGQAFAAAGTSVSTAPASYTPYLDPNVGGQNVHQIAQCGSTMYAVGTISSVKQATLTYTRDNAFSFSATNGTVTGWNPDVNGLVSAITFSPDCSTAYLGGRFTSVHGTTVKDLVAVDTSTGAVIDAFAHHAAAQVVTLQYVNGQVIAGGQFNTINGASRTQLASLEPSTGKVTGYVNLAFSGQYSGSSLPTKVYNSQVSNDGTRMLVEGVFTSIDGQPRQQIAMLDLSGSTVGVGAWHATEFDNACVTNEALYAKSATWGPGDSAVYVATTGYKPNGGSTSAPRSGLCDAVSKFPASNSTVTHTWINYAGCDSLYSVAADSDNVYIAGHERYADNPNGCDSAGPGAVSRPGVGDIDPVSGLATSWNPTRSRGHGAEDLLLTSAGLWIASDNGNGTSQQCGGFSKHGGICFLPN
ncbi:MAG: hypothetical protein QOD35_3194 [Nocardioidaceae bacterium]|nr:hypothetical protein [Nocardioidaceae bacterium]